MNSVYTILKSMTKRGYLMSDLRLDSMFNKRIIKESEGSPMNKNRSTRQSKD